jgi:hypothetical protein
MAAEPDALDVPKLVTLIGAGVALTILSVVGMQALYWAGEREQFEIKEIPHVPAELVDLEAAQRTALQQADWVDKEKGKVQIPIDTAKKLVLQQKD